MAETSPRTRIGIVGLGKISAQYLATLPALRNLTLTRVADLDRGRVDAAVAASSDVGLSPVGCTPDELYAADDVDLVVNLTTPDAHRVVASAAVAAGKHVYGEKPLAATTSDAVAVLAEATAAGVRVGCAPDTVLGTGVQTARHALDAGAVGAPVAATAFLANAGPEGWHPDPEFYYAPGGGPLLDMGPYYLTTLVTLLGPVRRVVGLSSVLRPTRTVGSGAKAGLEFPVEVPTHVTGVVEHESGVLSTVVMSFDVQVHRLPRIEVYGSEGTLSLPDPNHFGGEVSVWAPGADEWTTVPVSGGYLAGGRGVGVADLAAAIAAGAPHRASGELALHVLEVMERLLESGREGRALEIEHTCGRPAAVPDGPAPWDVA